MLPGNDKNQKADIQMNKQNREHRNQSVFMEPRQLDNDAEI